MSVQKRAILLSQIDEIHEDWLEEIKTNELDALPEDIEVYHARIAPLLRELKALGGGTPEGESLDDKVSSSVEFHLAVNGEIVQMLVKHDFEEGLLSYRSEGEWVPIGPDDDLPALDEADLEEVVGEATELWDEAEGGELLLSDFNSVLLDKD